MTLSDIRIRPATEADLETVLDILSDAAAWAASRGFANWPERFPRNLVERTIAAGTVRLAETGARPIATITLQWEDEMFWGPMPPDAGYVHRLAVRTDDHGLGIGPTLLEWASREVLANDRAWLRLDIVSTNSSLRRYYEGERFVHVRDIHGEFTRRDGTIWPWQTSLYERRCGLEP